MIFCIFRKWYLYIILYFYVYVYMQVCLAHVCKCHYGHFYLYMWANKALVFVFDFLKSRFWKKFLLCYASVFANLLIVTSWQVNNEWFYISALISIYRKKTFEYPESYNNLEKTKRNLLRKSNEDSLKPSKTGQKLFLSFWCSPRLFCLIMVGRPWRHTLENTFVSLSCRVSSLVRYLEAILK